MNALLSCRQTNRYRAKVAFVSPLAKRRTFESEPACFLGVSLENRNFTPERFSALIEWVARRFKRCQILIGDSIHRITLETTQGFPSQEALLRATQLGKNFMTQHHGVIDAYRHTTDFQYVTCSAIQKTKEYKENYQKIQAYFDAHAGFRQSVEAFGQHYHRRAWAGLSEAARLDHTQQSSRYFLEEFAVFTCLVRAGTPVMVYPGSFSTLTEVVSGAFPGIIAELQALSVVSLTLKRR